jgi:hypothetical protein
MSIFLTLGSPTTLTGFAGPFTGDATWAFEWDRTLAPNKSLIISKNKQIEAVPEPTALWLLGGGLLGAGLLRRKR